MKKKEKIEKLKKNNFKKNNFEKKREGGIQWFTVVIYSILIYVWGNLEYIVM
jgi:hypothetical protein